MGDLSDAVTAVTEVCSNRNEGGKSGHDFAEKGSADGNDRGDLTSFRKKDEIQNIAAANPCNLFQKLDAGRQSGLLPGIVITVDA